jgi:hypothetical protein
MATARARVRTIELAAKHRANNVDNVTNTTHLKPLVFIAHSCQSF